MGINRIKSKQSIKHWTRAFSNVIFQIYFKLTWPLTKANNERAREKKLPIRTERRETQLWSFNESVMLNRIWIEVHRFWAKRMPNHGKAKWKQNTKIRVWIVVYFLSAQFINRNVLKCRNTAANAIYLLFYFTVFFIFSPSLPLAGNIVRSKYYFIYIYLYLNVHSASFAFCKMLQRYRMCLYCVCTRSTDR